MKVASWNVNSVRTRIDNILEWIKKENPDILCLQEIKVVTESFPREPFEDLGYNLIINGQKSYNGVATLSKFLIEENINIVVQFNGKKRGILNTKKDILEEDLVKEILKSKNFAKFLKENTIKKRFYVKNRLINFLI